MTLTVAGKTAVLDIRETYSSGLFTSSPWADNEMLTLTPMGDNAFISTRLLGFGSSSGYFENKLACQLWLIGGDSIPVLSTHALHTVSNDTDIEVVSTLMLDANRVLVVYADYDDIYPNNRLHAIVAIRDGSNNLTFGSDYVIFEADPIFGRHLRAEKLSNGKVAVMGINFFTDEQSTMILTIAGTAVTATTPVVQFDPGATIRYWASAPLGTGFATLHSSTSSGQPLTVTTFDSTGTLIDQFSIGESHHSIVRMSKLTSTTVRISLHDGWFVDEIRTLVIDANGVVTAVTGSGPIPSPLDDQFGNGQFYGWGDDQFARANGDSIFWAQQLVFGPSTYHGGLIAAGETFEIADLGGFNDMVYWSESPSCVMPSGYRFVLLGYSTTNMMQAVVFNLGAPAPVLWVGNERNRVRWT